MQETLSAASTHGVAISFDEKNRQLAEAFRAGQASRCIASVTHDVNNCLGAIMAYAELVSMDENLPDESRRMMGEVVKAVRDGTTLMGALTTIASDGGKSPKTVLASTVLDRVIMLHRDDLKAANIQVDVQARGVPNSLEVDEPSVARALMYLMSNEIEDARQAGRTRIHVTINERKDCVAFEVAHGGAPIPADRHAAMFEPFYTSKGANRLGLGLSEARAVAKRHGGELEYDTERGFVFTLPREMQSPRD